MKFLIKYECTEIYKNIILFKLFHIANISLYNFFYFAMYFAITNRNFAIIFANEYYKYIETTMKKRSHTTK